MTDNEIDEIAQSMPGGLDGFLKHWGWRQFARAVIAHHDVNFGSPNQLTKQIEDITNELETERMKVVACGCVAMADTLDSSNIIRSMHPDYWSESCSDVARRVDECIALRSQCKEMLSVLRAASIRINNPSDPIQQLVSKTIVKYQTSIQ